LKTTTIGRVYSFFAVDCSNTCAKRFHNTYVDEESPSAVYTDHAPLEAEDLSLAATILVRELMKFTVIQRDNQELNSSEITSKCTTDESFGIY
jgi:hypothetical protein